jgi:hypothetical protein
MFLRRVFRQSGCQTHSPNSLVQSCVGCVANTSTKGASGARDTKLVKKIKMSGSAEGGAAGGPGGVATPIVTCEGFGHTP